MMAEPGTLPGCPPQACTRLFEALTRVQYYLASKGC